MFSENFPQKHLRFDASAFFHKAITLTAERIRVSSNRIFADSSYSYVKDSRESDFVIVRGRDLLVF